MSKQVASQYTPQVENSYLAPHVQPKVRSRIIPKVTSRIQPKLMFSRNAKNDPLEQEADKMGKLASEGKSVEVNSFVDTCVQMKNISEEAKPWKEVEDTTKYLISSKDAFIRELKDNNFALTESRIQKWTEVKITKESMDGKYVFVVQTKESPLKEKKKDEKNKDSDIVTNSDTTTIKNESTLTGLSNNTTEWWTSKSNLYSTNWIPKENEVAYKKISNKYAEQMLQNDPKETIKDLVLSGSSTKGIIDKYFKNSTDTADLDADFKTKYDKLKKCLNDNGITFSVSAMLRHPLRSAIFNYTIAVRDASSTDIICEANAVCQKYGIPINWAHLDEEGNIDLKESKAKAKVVSDAFALGKNAARSLSDFGGAGISNHNHGKAIDLTLSFSFVEKKKITFGDNEYEIDPKVELAGQTAKSFKDVANSQLTLLGYVASGLKRSIDSDPIHWSETGN